VKCQHTHTTTSHTHIHTHTHTHTCTLRAADVWGSWAYLSERCQHRYVFRFGVWCGRANAARAELSDKNVHGKLDLPFVSIDVSVLTRENLVVELWRCGSGGEGGVGVEETEGKIRRLGSRNRVLRGADPSSGLFLPVVGRGLLTLLNHQNFKKCQLPSLRLPRIDHVHANRE
jgi:hypothetical protein